PEAALTGRVSGADRAPGALLFAPVASGPARRPRTAPTPPASRRGCEGTSTGARLHCAPPTASSIRSKPAGASGLFPPQAAGSAPRLKCSVTNTQGGHAQYLHHRVRPALEAAYTVRPREGRQSTVGAPGEVRSAHAQVARRHGQRGEPDEHLPPGQSGARV